MLIELVRDNADSLAADVAAIAAVAFVVAVELYSFCLHHLYHFDDTIDQQLNDDLIEVAS